MEDFHGFVKSLNEGEAKYQRAGFIMNLKAINNKILFYPTFEDIQVISKAHFFKAAINSDLLGYLRKIVVVESLMRT